MSSGGRGRAKIALVPLDDRPPSLNASARLAEIADVDLLTPPAKWIGSFTRYGQPEHLIPWMAAHARAVDALVLSADMLCFGGLFGSRALDSPFVKPESWLQLIGTIRQAAGGRKPLVLVSSVILRHTISARDRETLRWTQAIRRYSELADPSNRGPDQVREQQRLQSSIPAELLQSYLRVRKRNHDVNLELVRAMETGSVDRLLLVQEDATLRGIHRSEHERLMRLVQDLGVDRSVFLHPGGDEAALTLLSYAILKISGLTPEIEVRVFPAAAGDWMPPYEHQPLEKSVSSQAQAAGFVERRNASTVLLVFAGDGQIGDGGGNHFTAHGSELSDNGIVVGPKPGGLLIGMADIATPNVASDAVLEKLCRVEKRPIGLVDVYAGWNTAGNSIGSALAHLSAIRAGPGSVEAAPAAHYEYLFERLVSDWLYPNRVRPILQQWARNSGRFEWNLGDATNDAERRLNQQLRPAVRRLFEERFQGLRCSGGRIERLERLCIRLPWPRLFEVNLQCRFGLSSHPGWAIE